MWLLCGRSWPFSMPPGAIDPDHLQEIERRMLELIPDPNGEDEI